MIKTTIETNKGYICEVNAKGTYPVKENGNMFYAKETGKWFTSICANCAEVDRLGFTDKKEEATRYGSRVGERVQEIYDRIKMGYEEINFIKLELENEKV